MSGASTLGSYYGVNSGISSLAGKEATGLATNAVNWWWRRWWQQ